MSKSKNREDHCLTTYKQINKRNAIVSTALFEVVGAYCYTNNLLKEDHNDGDLIEISEYLSSAIKELSKVII